MIFKGLVSKKIFFTILRNVAAKPASVFSASHFLIKPLNLYILLRI